MPKRKTDAGDAETAKPEVKRGRGRPPMSAEADAGDSDAADAVEKSPKETAKPEVKRGRGRPPMSAEEKAKREAVKKPKGASGRGRGRPKGSTKNKKK